MNRADYWIRNLIEAGQSHLDINHVVADIGRSVGADVSILFLGSSPKLSLGHVFHAGIEQPLLEYYERHSQSDVYLRHYSQQNLQGTIVPLQTMLPLNKITDEWFRDEMLRTIAVKHSLSGYCRLNKSDVQVLTFHRYSSPFKPECQLQLQQLMDALVPWSQYYLSKQQLMNKFGTIPLQHGSLQLPDTLTPAERQVIQLLSRGYDGSEITQFRGVSKETTKSQIKSILHKLECKHQNHLLHKVYTELVT
ncbi:LuxR family transcriptional regulator [Photobacterium gaetbulicola]|uniref:Putative DNA-binding HTH domain-containing protein n=1 Tax=Photobacterium gaetbulicola Gung47 TaxID=658445 RepID=A0A0C5W2Z3_9GAMM|nr:helix-turn-helix transcriptional regulator [Photobacterium gaetbulicola]AJR05721.1 putative DNA-binding HTH domain-containing protein [Photobacterium gaetbulicola Gung47]PSU14690.1 LuxR family transcriptional regulator [Photobacterium gaetbulicola]